MTILQKNIAAFPQLQDLYNKKKDDLYDVEPGRKGNYTLRLNNMYLHSKYDPVKEAGKIIEVILSDIDNLDIIIFYGNGLGYILRLVYENYYKNPVHTNLPQILYIEADASMYLTSLQYFDYSEILNHEKFTLFIEAEKETVGSFIQSIPTKRIRYYYHRPSYLLNEHYYKEMQNYITYVLNRKDMNTATITRFQKLWTKNFIYNLPVYFGTNKLKTLKNIAHGTTAAIIAGGPTLEKQIEYLKANQEALIVIAVDTVYKYLKKHAIIPDIIVTVDPQFWNYKYLENEHLTDSIIVTESSVYPKIFTLASANRYFTGSSIFQTVKYFDEKNDERGNLAAGGSVSTTAFDVARLMGCKEIFLVGLDLSYPNRMTHFKGAFFEHRFLTISDYFNTPEHASYNYLTHAGLTMVRSTNGHVFTDRKMLIFKSWFDREVPLTDVPVYMPNSGGVLIEGVTIIEPDQRLSPDKTAKQQYRENIAALLNSQPQLHHQLLSDKINIILKYTVEIQKICKNITGKISNQGDVKLSHSKEIEKYEEQLFDNPEKSMVTKLISSSAQDILLSIMENVSYNDDEKKSAWLKTKHLYTSIIELTKFYEKSLKKTLKRLDK